MRCKNHKTACETAQANAVQNGWVWIVFCDTSGVWNTERSSPDNQGIEGKESFQPLPKWAEREFKHFIQACEAEGISNQLDSDVVCDDIYGMRPAGISFDQFEKEINPLIKIKCRQYGIK